MNIIQVKSINFIFSSIFVVSVANSEINTQVQRTSVLPCQWKLAASGRSQFAASLLYAFDAILLFAICNKSAVRKLQQVCCSQFPTSLLFAICSKSADHNLQQVCRFQLAASLPITICIKHDNIKSEQAMQTHPDIGLMITSRNKSAAGLLQLGRFWLCTCENKKF